VAVERREVVRRRVALVPREAVLGMIEAAATVAQRASPSMMFRCGHESAGTATKSVMTSSGATDSALIASAIARLVACRMLTRSMVR
jgi:hypothetical protein